MTTPEQKLPEYEWVTAREMPSVADNQTPGRYIAPLFRQWTREGWEIVSVMTLPPKSACDMCVAVGVLRRAALPPEA